MFLAVYARLMAMSALTIRRVIYTRHSLVCSVFMSLMFFPQLDPLLTRLSFVNFAGICGFVYGCCFFVRRDLFERLYQRDPDLFLRSKTVFHLLNFGVHVVPMAVYFALTALPSFSSPLELEWYHHATITLSNQLLWSMLCHGGSLRPEQFYTGMTNTEWMKTWVIAGVSHFVSAASVALFFG